MKEEKKAFVLIVREIENAGKYELHISREAWPVFQKVVIDGAANRGINVFFELLKK